MIITLISFLIYPVKDLEAKDQFALLNEVIRELDTHGFIVTRIVTDNLSTNTKTFKLFNQGRELTNKVKHPLGGDRPDIRLSFDPSHVLKNVWTQFIDPNRVLS